MMKNIQRLDYEEPCGALFDEMEKIFSKDQSDGGHRATLMSQLLWWLAERKSRVLVIMTTNKANAIPPELYRERRLDKSMVLKGLQGKEVNDFATAVFETFKIKPTAADLKAVASEAAGTLDETAHSAVTAAVFKHVKAGKLAAEAK